MRLATKATLVYSFEELSKEAQAVAVQHYQESASEFIELDYVTDHLEEIGKSIGIDIDRIYYSGFYSQGDGLCFSGSYSYKKGWKEELVKIVKDEEIFEIAEALQLEQQKNFYQLSANVSEPHGNYSHYNSVNIDVYRYGKDTDNEHLEYLLREFMKWGYTLLREEYEYQTSEECARNYLKDSEQEFTYHGYEY